MAGLLARLFASRPGPRRLDESAWAEVCQAPVFAGLSDDGFSRLRELATQLLLDKTFSGAAGTEVDDAMATVIAAFAALPVLNLGYAPYRGWNEIIVYPAEFIHEGEEIDEAGIVHHIRHARSGEAMEGGPMVLSWDDVLASGGGEGYNVVIHEFAHKLDMHAGGVNGRPALHAGMSAEAWATAWNAAFAELGRRAGADGADAVDADEIDPYAAESPAECFAVLSEYFFEAPDVLNAHYPAVYEQLRLYYRQDPLARIETHEPANP